MATAKTTIELNGKLYDARTGKIIGEQVTKPAAKRMNTGVVDGFVRRPHVAAQPIVPKPSIARSAPQHVTAPIQKSKTLKRPAVKKPRAVVSIQPEVTKPVKKQDPQRLARAISTPKSSHVRRFNPNGTAHQIVKKQAQLEVIVPQQQHSAINRVAHLATSTEAHVKQSVDIIEESLRNASAHLEKFEDRVSRGSFLQRVGLKNKTANIATLSFAGLLLVGFFAFQNATAIEMKVASTRSGVSASMPGYSPAGFSAARNVDSSPGRVALTFSSNTSDKKFTVTQQASNWSSDSLLSNHVLASKTPFQSYQNEGKTVYIFDNSNATWVNGGIWYKIDGNASLTSDQLLRIASSFN